MSTTVEAARPSAEAGPRHAGQGLHARVQVGGQTLAVEAEAVLQALHLTQPPLPIPRRRGAVVGACASRWGVLPVIDLARWLDLGVPEIAGTQVLVLQAHGRRVAVRISGMHGVQPAVARHRLHQDDDPQELFESVVQWRDGALAPLLEVGRLAALSAIWCDETQGPFSTAESAPAASTAVAHGPHAPHAMLRVGGQVWAVAARALLKVVPSVPLELALHTGSAVRGICAWNGRKMPVVDLPALQSPNAPSTEGALMAILSDGALCVAVPVDGIERLAALPQGDEQADAPLLQPCLLPGLGEVNRVHVARLLAMLPEAGISRSLADPAREGATSAKGGPDWTARSAPYLLFDCGATFAAPVTPVLRLLPLATDVAGRLAAGQQPTLAFDGEAIPLVSPSSGSGGATVSAPAVAIVVGLPGGSRAALAVPGIKGWADARAVQPGVLRTAALGAMQTITLTRDGIRSTHEVVDLCEVVQALADAARHSAPPPTLQDLLRRK